ncbi:enterochelin esterase [Sphingorhabdus soli]|uniref:Enterochelin esterase n=1 Tax=Flavisphingopyxis soli TaxID=2601267 RepID=A0A5C6UNI6_9SPHN|nr:alpha/beta hydrolase-fold protein [Sphingorhabdus soli]TXC74160.1 enterochelin esterase [Sphingorhabdus soli]
MRIRLLLAAAFVLSAPASAQNAPVTIPVVVDADLGATQSGRILVFAKPISSDDKPGDDVDTSAFSPTGTAVVGREVTAMVPGTPALVGAETDAFPVAWSKLSPGKYRIQAVLDGDHSYNYKGRGAGDLVSKPVIVQLPGPVPTLTLTTRLPATDTDAYMASLPEARRTALTTAMRSVEPVDFTSPAMTAFWGNSTAIKGWVALPPGYRDGNARYPTVYSDGGFGSTLDSARFSAANMAAMMAAGDIPPMIWVFLDHHVATGTHEFADSVNNGPWGTALKTELIPALEAKYRMDARPSGRFLTGHSSGGWSTLWLQIAYPKVFGGSWPTSPDPSDFHDFTNIDLYAPGANFYSDAKGEAPPLIRDKGKVIASIADFGRLEAALGPYGGQFASFEWVFSPRCPDGRPCTIFDRATGAVDPKVAAYWRDHYDIAHIVARDWPTLKPDLDGKIHLIVGSADTFYLDGPAHRLQAVLDGLGAKSSFRYLPGKTHFDLFEQDGDRQALMKTIAGEMYAVARPNG